MIHVTAAILQDAAGNYLLCRRGPGGSAAGLWEFPGGKQEAGETLPQCLERECREELNIQIQVASFYESVQPKDTELCIHFYRCQLLEGIPTPSVHSELFWCPPKLLPSFSFCPADTAIAARLAKE